MFYLLNISCGWLFSFDYACVALLLSMNLCSHDFVISPCILMFIEVRMHVLEMFDGNKFL